MTSDEERRLLGEKLVELAQKSRQLKLVRDEVRLWARRLEDLRRSLERERSQLTAEEREILAQLLKLPPLVEEQESLALRVAELEHLL